MAKQSQFIGFRLHPSKKPEREALRILNSLKEEGYETRYIMCAALLALDEIDIPAPESGAPESIDDLRDMMREIRQMLANGSFAVKANSDNQPLKMNRAMLNFVKYNALEGDDDDDDE